MILCLMLGVIVDFSAYLPLRRKHPVADAASLIGLGLICCLAVAYFLALRAQSAGETSTVVIVLAVLLGAIPLALFVLAIMGLYGKLGRPKATVKSDRLSALITAIGMSIALQTIAQLVWGADFRNFPKFEPGTLGAVLDADMLSIGSATLKGKELVIWIVTAVLMVGLTYLVARTKIGKAMRACALDQKTAALMGVNVNWVIAVTFMIGSALAAVAGILFAIKIGGNISFRMGYYPGVIAFAAAVLGGIGSIRGAVVGGMIIGATQALVQVTSYAAYDFAFAFGLMILVILVRPWGIYGKPGAARA
jgi:branched-chain amino acid transport system permease protein